MVKEYTNRKLTVPSDRLPGILGIVKIYQETIRDRCHYGIWERDLPFGLLWFADPLDPRYGPPNLSRAPSWSWVSKDCKISWVRGFHDWQSKPCILSTLAYQDSSQTIRASGALKRLDESCTQEWFECQPYRYSGTVHRRRIFLRDLLPTYVGSSHPDLFILPIVYHAGDGFGLVLVREEEKSDPLYRRIGIFELHDGWDLSDREFSLLELRRFSEWDSKLDRDCYETKDSEGNYTIYIT